MVFEAPALGFNASLDGQRQNSRQAHAQENLSRDSQSHESRANWHPGHNKEWTAAMQATLNKDLKVNNDGTYTVQYPDCLRSIAARELHMMGKKATKHAIDTETDRLVELNKDRYPSLAKNRDLILGGSQHDGKTSEGWRLKLSLGDQHGRHEKREPQRPPTSANDRAYYENPGREQAPHMGYRRPVPPQPMPYDGRYQDYGPQANFAPRQNFAPQYRDNYYNARPQSNDAGQGLAAVAGIAGMLFGGGLNRGIMGPNMMGQRDYWHRGYGRPDYDYDDYDRTQRWQRGYGRPDYDYDSYSATQPWQRNYGSGIPPYQYNDYSSNSLPLLSQSQGWGNDYSYGRGYSQYGMQQQYRRQQQNRGVAGIGRMLGLF